jgi:ankyrin repeat protein
VLALTRRHSASPPVQDGATPLHIASAYGLLEAVKALIEGRADVEAKTNVSSTSGMHARTDRQTDRQTHTHTNTHTHTHTHTHTQGE